MLRKGRKEDEEEARQETKVEEEQLAVDNTPWMRKSRWARKFAGKDLRAIAALSEKPAKEDKNLQTIWASVARVFQQHSELA